MSLPSYAQLNVIAKPIKNEFVAHERIGVDVQITNRTGRTVLLRGIGLDNWLNINVYDKDRKLLPYFGGAPTFKGVQIPVGETVTKRLYLTDYYDMTRPGKFTFSVNVKLPGNTNESVGSPTKQFNITLARVIAKQKIGIPGTATARTYEILRHNGKEGTYLYAKITNDFTTKVVLCAAISKVITTYDPQVAIDSKNNLHVLYLLSNQIYAQVTLDPTGKLVKATYHKQGAYDQPRLVAFANGEVKVAGTIIYDPKAEREKAEKGRKLSDRPNF